MANTGYLQITRQCNQKCVFCSNPPNNAKDLTLGEAKKILDDFKKKGLSKVNITGGEPTIHPNLVEFVKLIRSYNMTPGLITNGQFLIDRDLMKSLLDAGLAYIHVSVHSPYREIQERLSATKGSFDNILVTLHNCQELKVDTRINTVINSVNARHLHKHVAFFVKHFPIVRHYIFNNIDPSFNRASKNPWIVARLSDFEDTLFKACMILKKHKKTFRIERVPLCYMVEFAAYSTETRFIVKRQRRSTSFLDEKGMVHQENFFHHKFECCKHCKLDPICAGLFEKDKYFDPSELYAVFVDPQKIINEVLSSEP